MEPIAIIGIGCRFADATNPQEYFELLKRGVDATVEAPQDRWNLRSFYDPERGVPGKLTTCRGGFLPQIDKFDAKFFGISPREAACMDPQQRLMLEVTWEAMEDAGIVPQRLAGTDVGVFVGAFTLDYKAIQLGYLNRDLIDTHTATGSMMTMVSNRISYTFDFRGPSMSVDTACSSSLVAVHLACGSLRGGECSIALAGGVNVMVTPEYTIAESKGGFLAPDGRSKPFSASANGYGRAEGAGVVVLKPLSAAIADGDPIYAVIRGSAVNQDGHTNGITVPSGDAQARLIEEACRRAGVVPGQVQYVEAHGTGTPVGDPIEVEALAKALGKGRPDGEQCIIGSVKGNIGHAEAGAGVAGLIKTVMCIQNRQIPPNLHFDDPNPAIPFNALPVRVPTRVEDWPDSDAPALAGVNSFGFGGTNAHVIVEEAPQAEEVHTPSEEARSTLVFPLSARSPEALTSFAQSVRDLARTASERGITLADMYYSSALRRSHHDCRMGVVARSTSELADLLDAAGKGESRAAVATGNASGVRPKLAWVCTGMGPQWWAMGRQLFADEPVFRKAVLECDDIFVRQAGWSLVMEMMADEKQSRMADTALAQPANFAIQVGLAALWKSWGIVPDAIVGHSVGEVSSAYLSGALSLQDAICVSFHRSRLQQTTAGAGAMLAVGLHEEELAEWLEMYEGRISIAAVNSPASATLSGDPLAVQDLSERLSAKQIFNRALRVNIAYHSAQMEPLQDELLRSLGSLTPQSAHTPLYSTVTGGRVAGTEFDADYWWRNVREPVRFRGALDSLILDGFEYYLEIGPHPVLASSIAECLSARGRKGVTWCSLRRAEDERSTMLNSLAALYATGFNINWEAFRHPLARFVRLPSYPWQRERHWSESEASIADRTAVAAHPLLGRRTTAAQPTWETEINTRLLGYLQDHAISGAVVFPGAGYVEMALAAAREIYGDGSVAVEDIRFERALFLPGGERPKAQITLNPDEGTFEIHSRTASGAWARNARGRVVQDCGAGVVHLESAPLQRRWAPALDKKQSYAKFAEQGFQYGPAFQKIERLQTGAGEAVAWFPDMDVEDAAYQLHPAVLDACFQVLVATDPFRADDGTSRAYLPVGITRIRVLQRPRGPMWAWARLTRRSDSGAVGSISVCDETGAIAVEIEGFEVRSLDTAEGAVTREMMDRNLYDVRWIAAPEGEQNDIVVHPDSWLVFADNSGLADKTAERLEGTVVVVRPGLIYSFDRAAGKATINPAIAEDSQRLVLDLLNAAPARLTGIVHMWNLDNDGLLQSSADLDKAESFGAVSVLHLVQAVVQSALPARLWVVTRGAQPVADDDAVSVLQSPVWGLGRVTGHQEHINLWGGLIDLDPSAPVGEVEPLLAELTQSTGEDQVAFRQGLRHVARLTRCYDLQAGLPVRLRPEASYIVTGAFGALGMLTARWMVQRGARRLLLLGRSSVPDRTRWDDRDLTPEITQRIEYVRSLEAMGATVTLASVDVADEAQLEQFLSAYKRDGGPPIRGIIHSAGLVRDQLMVQMEAASFSNVLRPKVRGAWNLHRLLADDPLDFFVLYSSIGSLVAATGQANYAAANAFLDALAHHRRRRNLPAISINWGPWAVGMVKDLNLIEHYDARGLHCITPEEGMAFLQRLIGQRNAQAAVLTADWPRLATYQPVVSAMIADLAAEAATNTEGTTNRSDENFLHALILSEPAEHVALMEQHVQTLAARVLRMDRDKVDPGQPLSALGLDSMMAMELKNRIELSLQIPVSVLDLLKGVSISEFAQSLLLRITEENAELRALLDELAQAPGPEAHAIPQQSSMAVAQQ